MSGLQRSYSADFIHIEEALKDEWVSFVRLNEEIEAFEPLTKESFKDFKEKELERYKALNPGLEEKEVLEFVEKQVNFTSSLDMQFYSLFSRRLWSQDIKITTLAHALTEAQINGVLAMGLSQVQAVELFQIFEKSDLKKKWLYAPKSFYPRYEFPIGSGMHETLISLIKRRNAIVHYKIELTVEKTKVLDGSKIRRGSIEEDRNWLIRYFSLPYDLSQFLHKEIEMPQIMILFDRTPIETVSAHAT